MKKVGIGIVGIGAISGIYLENITKRFTDMEIVGVCDLVSERAQGAVEKYGIPKQYADMHELFADPSVEIVLNLTRPYEHFEVSKAALEAGKHVYSEKPLAACLDEGRALVKLAQEKGLLLGGAPDTFMGAGIQTCRKLIDNGYIGEPVGAAGFMICRGHESWHPDPDFYYQFGGGPLFDMSPYYLTALVNLLGGVKSVYGSAHTSFATRLITSEPHRGETIQVNTPTHINSILEFASGIAGTLITTFDVYGTTPPHIEVYGSEGTLLVPDPNGFGGPIHLVRAEDSTPREIPLMFGYADDSRGLGLADMAKALRTGREFRAPYQQTFHVLEIMDTILQSGREGRRIDLSSSYTRRAPMVRGALDGILED